MLPTRALLVLSALVMPTSAAIEAQSSSAGRTSREVIVELETVADSASARLWGMGNIFFDTLRTSLRDSVRVGSEWRGLEIADVVTSRRGLTIRAVRFRVPGNDSLRYVVDADGDGDFIAEHPLMFTHREGASIAEFPIELGGSSGTRRTIPYQLLRSDDGRYDYARAAEYRRGRARIGGRDHAIVVWRRGPRDVSFTLRSTTVLVDLDGDGVIAETAGATVGGRPTVAEQIEPSVPFSLEGRNFKLAEIDSEGTRLVLRPFTATVEAAEGFRAPAFSARTLTGSLFRLGSERGKVVLISFWSVDCRFSEEARPVLNDMARRLPASRFRWVAMSREGDGPIVRRHLAEHPMRAIVAAQDSASWSTYNPQTATPLFYVIDRRGIVRLRAVGSTSASAVAARMTALLAER